jgi:hypothetical protein
MSYNDIARCDMSAWSDTMGSMPARDRKPRMTVQLEPSDRTAIDTLLRRFPGATESFLVRAALRIGLRTISKDAASIAAPELTPAELEAPGSAKKR